MLRQSRRSYPGKIQVIQSHLNVCDAIHFAFPSESGGNEDEWTGKAKTSNLVSYFLNSYPPTNSTVSLHGEQKYSRLSMHGHILIYKRTQKGRPLIDSFLFSPDTPVLTSATWDLQRAQAESQHTVSRVPKCVLSLKKPDTQPTHYPKHTKKPGRHAGMRDGGRKEW